MVKRFIYRTDWKVPCNQDCFVCQLLIHFKAIRTVDQIADHFSYYTSIASTPEEDSSEVRRLKVKFAAFELNEIVSDVLKICCLGKARYVPIEDNEGGWLVSPYEAMMDNIYLETISIDYDDFNGFVVPVSSVKVYDHKASKWVEL